jgi:D-alanine-D-alanine ligase
MQELKIKEKKSIAIIFGGNNFEHHVSLKTGYNISKELIDYNKFILLFIGIDHKNKWYYSDDIDKIIENPQDIRSNKINTSLPKIFQIGNGKINNEKIDCVFLATHGKYVEDGNLQGFLKTNNLNYTGSDVNGSVIAINKHLAKIIAKENNISTVDSVCLYTNNIDEKIDNKIRQLGNKLVVKINSGGSSEGVFFSNYENINIFLKKAFQLDNIVLIEKQLQCREISIGIIESEKGLLFSQIGEYGKNNNYFSFEEKYKNKNKNIVPAVISNEIKEKIISNAQTLFKKLSLKNYARIDFFLTNNNQLYFNEVNSLPGFYKKSLFSLLWGDNNYIDVILAIINNSINSSKK